MAFGPIARSPFELRHDHGRKFHLVGVSKSAVSRETVEASERVLKELMERRLDAWDLLVIYLDGIQMGSHHVLAAVGVGTQTERSTCWA